jgi:NTP pyrophosphatase (non-canonical NTP hydrolase)
MKMDEYQERAGRTNIYPDTSDGFHAQIFGLCSEAGEVADKFNKRIRDYQGDIMPDITDEIIKELGDCLWFISQIALKMECSLEYVAECNLRKLADRADRGKIGGSGDER